MDLNELLHAHQVELIRASSSGTGKTRENHFEQVAQYADHIRKLRTISPEAALPERNSEPHTIIYGSYAGASATEPSIVSASVTPDIDEQAASENPDRGRADS
jgi:hypothetical protein